jgi:hypothetical protein
MIADDITQGMLDEFNTEALIQGWPSQYDKRTRTKKRDPLNSRWVTDPRSGQKRRRSMREMANAYVLDAIQRDKDYPLPGVPDLPGTQITSRKRGGQKPNYNLLEQYGKGRKAQNSGLSDMEQLKQLEQFMRRAGAYSTEAINVAKNFQDSGGDMNSLPEYIRSGIAAMQKTKSQLPKKADISVDAITKRKWAQQLRKSGLSEADAAARIGSFVSGNRYALSPQQLAGLGFTPETLQRIGFVDPNQIKAPPLGRQQFLDASVDPSTGRARMTEVPMQPGERFGETYWEQSRKPMAQEQAQRLETTDRWGVPRSKPTPTAPAKPGLYPKILEAIDSSPDLAQRILDWLGIVPIGSQPKPQLDLEADRKLVEAMGWAPMDSRLR